MVTAYGLDCMVLRGRKAVCRPPPSTYPAPRSQQPWEAQEDAHRDRSRVNLSFCKRPGVATRLGAFSTERVVAACV